MNPNNRKYMRGHFEGSKAINKQVWDAEPELAALNAKRTALEENHAASGPEVINCR